jgi:serine phosphatase RsbU (regulator of sigma subunit)
MKILKILPRAFWLLFCLLILSTFLMAQSGEKFTLTAEKLKDGKTAELNKAGWKYYSGDNLNWANRQLDDSDWEILDDSALKIDKPPQSGWSGIGWFRLRVTVEESLANKQLSLTFFHWGASEIYVDGELINKYGSVGGSAETEQAFNPNGMPMFFSFNGAGAHVIAVRHSVAAVPELSSFWNKRLLKINPSYGLGFNSSIGEANSLVSKREGFLKLETANRFARAGLLLTIGLLFLLMYSFFPSQRANLYFALFALATVGNNLCNYLISTGHYDLAARLAIDVFFWLFWAVVNVSLLAFLYTAFSPRIPKYFWIIVVVWTIYPFGILLAPESAAITYLHSLILFLTIIEELRIMIYALRRKISGAWIVGIGVLLFVSLQLINALEGINISVPQWIWFTVRIVSAIGITVAIAIYLARNFARLPKVEAENARRAKELEEARQLQLSLLPKKLPQISNLEIAAFMKPATEVGGDYYDFYVGDEGTLTVAVGDATGHGLKAGTVVTAAKTLFRSYAEEASIPHIFKNSSRVIKEMNLRGLFMAMTMLKIKDNNLVICTAGMPPMLIFRAAENRVEEVGIPAMPLGSVSNFTYQQEEFSFAIGDTMVLMSDGFPEMFDESGNMLGYEKAGEMLKEVANLSPQEIINRFVETGEKWAGLRAQDDDVTFVVIKIRGGDGKTL